MYKKRGFIDDSITEREYKEVLRNQKEIRSFKSYSRRQGVYYDL